MAATDFSYGHDHPGSREELESADPLVTIMDSQRMEWSHEPISCSQKPKENRKQSWANTARKGSQSDSRQNGDVWNLGTNNGVHGPAGRECNESHSKRNGITPG
jgi:hypothetical protein